MLEDRVSARTNAGGDSNEFSPETTVTASTVAQNLVGNVSVADWARNQTIVNGMNDLRVHLLLCFSPLTTPLSSSCLLY